MYTYGMYTYGMYTYGMYTYGMYTYGMYTYGIDTGHISIYGAIQSLKHGSMQNEDFDTTTDHFNAV
jgi:hypothetical protein